MKRVVIGGTASGVGKTTIALGIMGALAKKGLRVAPFKVGPDYIDPGFHAKAAGCPSRNLDSWMVAADPLRELFVRASAGYDIAVIEGVMGLYDGCSGDSDAGSTAEVAKLLDAPALLVVDASGMARSAAAQVLGYQRFDQATRLAAVIANNVGGERHKRWVEEAIGETTGLPLIGYLPRRSDLVLPERHLGLVPVMERPANGLIAGIIAQVEETVDLQALISIAESAGEISDASAGLFPPERIGPSVRIGVAADECFSFYYQDNLDLLAAWGAEVVSFSPLSDCRLPSGLGGLYLGGGFPEVFAHRLSDNKGMLGEIGDAVRAGLPTYAECGGLMYLSQSVIDFEGKRHGMAGVLPFDTKMAPRLSLGYRSVGACQDNFLLRQGEVARGHEFHRSEIVGSVPAATAAYALDASDRFEGYVDGNLLASYVHLHFGTRPDLAPRFVSAARNWFDASISRG